MSLIFYALFYIRDPLEFIPQEFWGIVNYLIIVLTIYGFYRKLVGGFRSEFNDRLGDFRSETNRRINDFREEIRRDLDRIDGTMQNLTETIESTKGELQKQRNEIAKIGSDLESMFPLRDRFLRREK
jgi:hypothetical protein